MTTTAKAPARRTTRTATGAAAKPATGLTAAEREERAAALRRANAEALVESQKKGGTGRPVATAVGEDPDLLAGLTAVADRTAERVASGTATRTGRKAPVAAAGARKITGSSTKSAGTASTKRASAARRTANPKPRAGASMSKAERIKANAGPGRNEAKHALAALIVTAAGEAIMALPSSELVQVYGGATPAELLAQVAQWLHYLPLGGVWPKGAVPRPDRSEWK